MTTQKMIDVSQWQGNIDWDKVKTAGYHAIIRLGWYGNTNYQIDTKFSRNLNACVSRGIPFGIYIYNYATNENRAVSMADWVTKQLGSVKPGYGIFLDLEESGTEKSALKVYNAFYNAMKAKGWPIVGLYTNLHWGNNYGLFNAKRDKLWLAQWASKASVSCDIWQYSSKGTVPGISGNVDMNYCYYAPGKIYNAASSNVSTLKVDGVWGKLTTTRLQKYLGVNADGIISNQWVGYRSKFRGLSNQSWQWISKVSKTGSVTIKALQKKLKVTPDGIFGPVTCKALQKHLNVYQDGKINNPSETVKALQTALNTGKF